MLNIRTNSKICNYSIHKSPCMVLRWIATYYIGVFHHQNIQLSVVGNPYPPVIPKPRETKYFLTNILVDELRKEHERQHRSPLVNKILQSSTENVDIDSIQKQYIQENTDNNITESDGSVVSEEADVNKNHK